MTDNVEKITKNSTRAEDWTAEDSIKTLEEAIARKGYKKGIFILYKDDEGRTMDIVQSSISNLEAIGILKLAADIKADELWD